MQYLNSAEIFALHKFIVETMGSTAGLRDQGLLFSICEKPKASFGGIELYEGIFTKAAVLLEATVNYHVFVDANKRTAWMATYTFLALNGYKLVARKKDAFQFVIGIAKKEIKMQEIAMWLEQHSRKG